MDNSTYSEQIMRYIDGEMTKEEKQEFEKELSGNEALKVELENRQLAKMAVVSFGLKEKVGSIHQQMMNELKKETPVKSINKVRRIVRYSVAIAASIILIFLGIEGYDFYRLNPNQLFADNYTTYELATTRDGQTAESSIEKAYREKNFTEVIRLNSNSVLSVKDIFLIGMSYLETNDLVKAISSYQVVIADKADDQNSVLKDAAEYYLALAYLKNRDFDQAIELMNKIYDNSSHLYKEKFTPKYIKKVKRLKWR